MSWLCWHVARLLWQDAHRGEAPLLTKEHQGRSAHQIHRTLFSQSHGQQGFLRSAVLGSLQGPVCLHSRVLRWAEPSRSQREGFLKDLSFMLCTSWSLMPSGCTTFRRSKLLFISKPGQNVHFGSFPSSSLNRELRHFGEKTCFGIHTCYGAYLKSYSEFDSEEEEVLIPPYEMFNIVCWHVRGESFTLWCSVQAGNSWDLQPSQLSAHTNTQANVQYQYLVLMFV